MAIIVGLSRKKQIKNTKDFLDSDLPSVTVQIPTYNELAALNCAKMCMNFDYPVEKIQIIIGDDSSDNVISKQIDQFSQQFPERLQITRRGNNIGYKPGNLNHMLEFSTGEIIVIFDSDFLPKKNFLKEIVKPFVNNPEIAAVQARWSIKNFENGFSSLWGGTIAYYTHYVLLPFAQLIGGNSFLCGSAEAIRKTALDEIGPWSKGALTEDIEYSLRLMAANKKILFLPHLKCEGEAPFNIKDLCKQQMRWAYGNISAFKNHFCTILRRKKKGGISFRDKLSVFIFWISYFLSIFVFFSTIFGVLSLITINPSGITLNWDFFLSPVTLSIIITSSLVTVWIISMLLSQNTKSIFKVLISMFTIGLIIPFYIVVGITKAIFGGKMDWFLVKKGGNEITENIDNSHN
jgi:cellulose synthase/poly-beta-1,6-N-acetylglucosamine synthase-like glycosyltransferase